VPKQFHFNTEHNNFNNYLSSHRSNKSENQQNFNVKTKISDRKIINTDRSEIKIKIVEQPNLEDAEWLSQQSKMGVQIKERMYFDDALKYLHNELHNLDI